MVTKLKRDKGFFFSEKVNTVSEDHPAPFWVPGALA